MRRLLVLTDEAARHPFRATLSPARAIKIDPVPFNAHQLFWLTFVSGFLAFYGFIA
jgi:hypothetical protein